MFKIKKIKLRNRKSNCNNCNNCQCRSEKSNLEEDVLNDVIENESNEKIESKAKNRKKSNKITFSKIKLNLRGKNKTVKQNDTVEEIEENIEENLQ